MYDFVSLMLWLAAMGATAAAATERTGFFRQFWGAIAGAELAMAVSVIIRAVNQ